MHTQHLGLQEGLHEGVLDLPPANNVLDNLLDQVGVRFLVLRYLLPLDLLLDLPESVQVGDVRLHLSDEVVPHTF